MKRFFVTAAALLAAFSLGAQTPDKEEVKTPYEFTAVKDIPRYLRQGPVQQRYLLEFLPASLFWRANCSVPAKAITTFRRCG